LPQGRSIYQPIYTKQFKKDIRRIEKSGSKDIEKLKVVIRALLEGKQLLLSHKDHELTSNYVSHRECHIEPDWLLVYKVNQNEKTIIFVRTGSHNDLFG